MSGDKFIVFCETVVAVAGAHGPLAKTAILRKMFREGHDGSGFKGDLCCWCRNLLPLYEKRIYRLQTKQLIKMFAKLLGVGVEQIDLSRGDVASAIGSCFTQPASEATLTLQEVDKFLSELYQNPGKCMGLFADMIPRCTQLELVTILRLIKQDLKMKAGARPVLNAIHPKAYEAYQSSHNLVDVVEKFSRGNYEFAIGPMVPIEPMLAEACNGITMIMDKCKDGMLAELKYDGERVQVHKSGDSLKYFSRSLKPVTPHKVEPIEGYLREAYATSESIILDAEILMVSRDGTPLPFGSLGRHKRREYEGAHACLVVFDCLYRNGKSLMDEPIQVRRSILVESTKIIENRLVLSEARRVFSGDELTAIMELVFNNGQEGLVLKPLGSTYKPGKRHWLKLKKDYMSNGIDTVDLVVLGAWYGTGRLVGALSIFLMGCWDGKRWVTVTKVHSGHSDATLAALQSELDMVEGMADWLDCHNSMVPDFVVRDPHHSQVWEIIGAEFTTNDVHTSGVSMRFPRVVKIRNDKDWTSATTLAELKALCSKQRASKKTKL